MGIATTTKSLTAYIAIQRLEIRFSWQAPSCRANSAMVSSINIGPERTSRSVSIAIFTCPGNYRTIVIDPFQEKVLALPL